jgi:hypothetical protein
MRNLFSQTVQTVRRYKESFVRRHGKYIRKALVSYLRFVKTGESSIFPDCSDRKGGGRKFSSKTRKLH